MIEISGHIERITFQSTDSGFTVARLKMERHSDLVCIVGVMPSIQPGEYINCYGNWKEHSQYGQQFDVLRYEVKAPASLVAIQKYLESGLIKGIGPSYAKKIVKKFGLESLNIIEDHPEKLLQIEGIGGKRLDLIIDSWQMHRSIRDVMLFLQSYEVSPAFAQKIFKIYGDQSIHKVKENPYQLARDIFGIGFKTADQLAQKMGIPANSSQRIDAGIEYVLGELSSDGHVCYPLEEFFPIAHQILEIPQEILEERVKALEKESRIVCSLINAEGKMQTYIWLKSLYIAEIGIAKELHRLRYGICYLKKVETEKAIDWAQKQLHIELAENQKLAVTQALEEKVQVITGGPGTGKSTITHTILTISQELTDKILLAAPTGRAAKRMAEITGRSASTIHSLLEYDFVGGGFKRNRKNPLQVDLLIIDESSMIDTSLMYSLLKAIPSYARVIFVGDINQLPSVGPGNVLKNLIDSKQIPVTMLNQIFRQAAGSKIVTNAHAINKGNMPDISGGNDSDFFFLPAETPEEILEVVKGLAAQRLPKRYQLDPVEDIQVLSPMKKGTIGTLNLNSELQQVLNPSSNPLHYGGKVFHLHDKVMQIRNNYNKEVFNGDIGRIIEIDRENKQLVLEVDTRHVIYEFDELDELVLAYAVSIHKYQGSECPCVIIPVHTTHFLMLHRNLLYTGVTRGKRMVILVGTKRALAIAVKNDTIKKRHSGLLQALLENGAATSENLKKHNIEVPF